MSKVLREERRKLSVKWAYILVVTVAAAVIVSVIFLGVALSSSDLTEVTMQAKLLYVMTGTWMFIGFFLGLLLSEAIVFSVHLDALNVRIRDAVLTEKVEEKVEKVLAEKKGKEGKTDGNQTTESKP